MNRFPISRVDHVRALPDRRLVVRARCPMCGQPQLELPIGPSTRCRDCGVGLRYVSNHLVPKTPETQPVAARPGTHLHPPAVGNGEAPTVKMKVRPTPKRATADRGKSSSRPVADKGETTGSGATRTNGDKTVNGKTATGDPAAAELDWIFVAGPDEAGERGGVDMPERLDGATPEQFARTIA